MRRPALTALALLGLLAAPASAHEGDARYESLVTRVDGVPGLRAQVLDGDDRLLLVHRGPRTVVVEGYEDEPYARLRPGGLVEVNDRATATYLNEERDGNVPVPAVADADAPPRWRVVGRSGRFEFHDHRIHWMGGEAAPPAVRDEAVRTKVFDWRVPVRVEGGPEGAVAGTLWWRGQGGGAPAGAYAALAAGAVVGLLLVVVVRRRRGRSGGDDGGSGGTAPPAREAAEAW